MKEGLLWFDCDPKRNLTEKIERAADRYRVKFGQKPNVCYVNPAMLGDEPQQINGVRAVPAPNVLKHHFWIGISEGKEFRKAA